MYFAAWPVEKLKIGMFILSATAILWFSYDLSGLSCEIYSIVQEDYMSGPLLRFVVTSFVAWYSL